MPTSLFMKVILFQSATTLYHLLLDAEHFAKLNNARNSFH